MLKKLNFKTKIVFIVAAFIVIGIVAVLYVTTQVGEKAVHRNLALLADDNAKIMADMWTYEFPGMYLSNGNLYTEDGINFENLTDIILEIAEEIDTDITMFIQRNGDFYRLCTTLKDANGKSMAGTMLGTSHAAYNTLINANRFSGDAVINGVKYITAYVPIKNDDGEIICIAFAGANQDEATNLIKKELGKSLPIIIIVSVLLLSGSVLLVLEIIKRDLTGRIERATDLLIQATKQVDGHASSIATAGNDLAQGSQEQASSIEEISASVEETTSMIFQTSEGAKQTANLTRALAEATMEGNESMEKMSVTIDNIKESSDEIGKIIKVIDDIASQTNILALNAAVEAARAGDAGKGFAVVAEEVRNLAQKSAESAKGSAEIIERNINLSADGVEMAAVVKSALSRIAEGVEKVKTIAQESADASSEESKGMEQVSRAMKTIEKSTMGTAEKASQNVEYSRSLQNEMVSVLKAIDELKGILGQK